MTDATNTPIGSTSDSQGAAPPMYLWQLAEELKTSGLRNVTVTAAQVELWARQARETADERDQLIEWQNTVTHHMPDSYDGDEGQEAIIDRWLNDLVTTANGLLLAARAGLADMEALAPPGAPVEALGRVFTTIVTKLGPILEGPNGND